MKATEKPIVPINHTPQLFRKLSEVVQGYSAHAVLDTMLAAIFAIGADNRGDLGQPEMLAEVLHMWLHSLDDEQVDRFYKHLEQAEEECAALQVPDEDQLN